MTTKKIGTIEQDGFELRYIGEDLDEIVARNASVHLERMDDNQYWLGIDLSDGTHLRCFVEAKKAKVTAFAEVERPAR